MLGALTGRCSDCLHPLDEHSVILTVDPSGHVRERVRVCRALVNGHVCACATPLSGLRRPLQADGQELEC